MIPREEWKHYGLPLHFIAANNCEFHRGTLVGNVVVSTVGRYLRRGESLFSEVGCRRFGETMVFRLNGFRHCSCPEIGEEIDFRAYSLEENVCSALDAGHEAMCEKWAEEQ